MGTQSFEWSEPGENGPTRFSAEKEGDKWRVFQREPWEERWFELPPKDIPLERIRQFEEHLLRQKQTGLPSTMPPKELGESKKKKPKRPPLGGDVRKRMDESIRHLQRAHDRMARNAMKQGKNRLKRTQ